MLLIYWTIIIIMVNKKSWYEDKDDISDMVDSITV